MKHLETAVFLQYLAIFSFISFFAQNRRRLPGNLNSNLKIDKIRF